MASSRCGAVEGVREVLWGFVRAHKWDYVWGPMIRAREFRDVVELGEYGGGTYFVVSARFLLGRMAPGLPGYDSAHNWAPSFRQFVQYAAFRSTALFGGYVKTGRDCWLNLYAVYVPALHTAEDLPWLYARQTAWEEDGRLVTAEEACRRGSKAACGALRSCWDCEWEGEVELYGVRYFLLEWD